MNRGDVVSHAHTEIYTLSILNCKGGFKNQRNSIARPRTGSVAGCCVTCNCMHVLLNMRVSGHGFMLMLRFLVHAWSRWGEVCRASAVAMNRRSRSRHKHEKMHEHR